MIKGGICMGYRTQIVCEKCGACLSLTRICTKGHVISWARASGWCVGKSILCSKCKDKYPDIATDSWKAY